MRTRSLQMELMADEAEGSALFERGDANRQQHSRVRSVHTPKRRSTRTPSSAVPMGIAARRNRRWAW